MKLEGDLQEIDLVPHLLELAEERFTGAIRFENDGIIKILYFKEGDVLSASTNDRADSVDEILLRAGKVNRDHIRQALGKRKDNETLGDALLSMGFISRKELAWGRRTQIVGILRSVAAWTCGSYQIVHDYLPNREEGTLFHLPQIILELAVTDPDKAKVEQRIEGGVAVFRKRPDFAERYGRLALNEDADAIAEQIDGARSAAEVAAVSKLDAFAVYKLLLALEWLRMVERDKPQVSHELYADSDFEPPTDGGAPGGAGFAPEPLLVPPIAEPPVTGLEDGGPEEPYPEPAWTPPDLSAAHLEPEEWAAVDVPAAVPERGAAPPAAKRSRSSLLLVFVGLLVLAAAAWAGWTWWQGRETAEPSVPPTRPVRAAKIPPPADGGGEPVPVPSTETASVIAAPPAPATEPGAAMPVPPAAATAPAPAAQSDPARARYQEAAESFARDRAGVAYTVQFELVCQTESVARALGAGPSVWFVPVQYRGQPCFRVFWGRYDTREEAERGKDEIPPSLRGSGPVVVRPRELLR